MPNNVIQKVYNGGNEYLVGGGSEGQEVVYLTQAEYDVLPASKLTDGKIYKVKTTGVPGGALTAGAGIDITSNTISADMTTAVYDNTTSGATATNMQDAMDEVFQSVSNGKELIADAITDKGVSTSATDSFQTMASNISSLDIATEGQIAAYNLAVGKQILFKTITGNSSTEALLNSVIGVDNYEVYRMGTYRMGTDGAGFYNYEIYKFFKDGTSTKIGETSYNVSYGYYDTLYYVGSDNTKVYYFSSSASYNDPSAPSTAGSGYTYDGATTAYTAHIGFDVTTGEVITTGLPGPFHLDRYRNTGVWSKWREEELNTINQHITLPYTISNVNAGNNVYNIVITVS